jgi:hypothetical protein
MNMATLRLLLIVSVLGLAGCASDSYRGYDAAYRGPSCPEGTTVVCMEDSLRGCACGELIVLN